MDSTKEQAVKTNHKKKNLLLLIIIVFLVGNMSFYLQERSKWIYEGQPYPKAKEWLIPANMMLVYTTTLAKLPLVDERSLVMKPFMGLQDYFVKKWQDNLPDNDAEKYLGWYVFKLRTHIVPNGGGIILYSNKNYSFDEVIEFNEKAWETIEAVVKYEAQDDEFNEIRLAAFNNLSALFVSNFTVYWIHNPVRFNPDFIDQSILENRYLSTKSYTDNETMLKDDKKFQQLRQLHYFIKKINNLYALKYSEIYLKSRQAEATEYWENSRIHKITKYIIFYLIETKQSRQIKNFCVPDSNSYLKDYMQSKKWLLSKEEFLKSKNISIEKTVSKITDELIIKTCPNINIKEELNNGNI